MAETAALEYKRRWTGGSTGFRFETKVTALTALRLLDQTQEFYLASNYETCDRLDDIVYSAQDASGKWSAWFIQIKHRVSKAIIADDLRGDNDDDFSLPFYSESWKTILEQCEQEPRHQIFGKQIREKNFVIFTNARLSETIQNRHRVRVPLIFATSDQDIAFKFNTKSDASLFRNFKDKALAEKFAEQFLLCAMQRSESDMDKYIQDEISRTVRLSINEIDLARSKWIQFIQDWSESKKFLTKTQARSQLDQILAEIQIGKKQQNAIYFAPQFCDYWLKLLQTQQFIYLTIDAANTELILSLLYQIGLKTYPNLYLTLDDFVTTEDTQLDYLSSYWTTPWTINCPNDTNLPSLEIFAKIRVNVKARVILVATTQNTTARKIAEIFNAVPLSYACVLTNLSDASQKQLLNRKLEFQGYETELATIIDSELTLINASLLTQLLQPKLPEIGKHLAKELPSYVPRVLMRNTQVSQGFFSLDTQSRFGLIHPSPLPFLTNKNLVYLNNASEFEKFAGIDKTRPFHMFEVKSGKNFSYYWRRSTGNVQEIAGHLKSAIDHEPRDNILQIQDKVMIICGKPGMGKSTLLQHLATRTKNYCPNYWVIMISLIDYRTYLQQETFNRDTIRDLLAAAAGIDTNNAFHTQFFAYCCHTGKIILLIDGFDEIHAENGLVMLDVLSQTPIARLWITTRSTCRETLESKLNVLSCSIKPFTKSDQEKFLKQAWKRPGMDETRLNTFVKTVLDKVTGAFSGKFQNFTQVALHTRMIADVCGRHLNDPQAMCKQINPIDLFQQFINLKRRAFIEKFTPIVTQYELELLEADREEKLLFLALLALLPAGTCAQLQPPVQRVENLQKFINDGNERDGIVMSFWDQTPQFIHRTFAEYYVAKYLAKHFPTNRTFLETDHFHADDFEVVRFFLNRFLASGFPLHEAAFDRDCVRIAKILEQGDVNANDVDRGGRTALHIAAAVPGSGSVINALLSAGVDANRADNVLGWQAIQYAKNDDANFKQLIEHSGSGYETNKLPITSTALITAVRCDNLQMFEYLVKNGLESVEKLDALSPKKWIDETIQESLTILHLCAAYNAKTILKAVLSRKPAKISLLEKPDKNGLTPLLWAAKTNHFESFKVLIGFGGNLYASSVNGTTVPVYAVKAHNLDILLTFLADTKIKKLSPVKYLSSAAVTLIADRSDWALKTISFLLATYPEMVNMNSLLNMTLLAAACIVGNERMVQKLLDFKADTAKLTPRGNALHLAVLHNHVGVVKILLDHDVATDVTTANGMTALHYSAEKGFQDVFFLLVNARADLNVITTSGDNLAVCAARAAQPDICRFLIQKKIDFRYPNQYSETGLALLKRNRARALVNMLEPVNNFVPAQVTKKHAYSKKEKF